jgi:hypothetical protein
MRKFFAGSLSATLLLCTASSARADFIDWSYNWTMNPGPKFTSGSGSVQFGLFNDRIIAAGNPEGLVVGFLGVFGTSSATTTPDRYGTAYDLTLHLKDNHSRQTADLAFHGGLAGTLTADVTHLSNTFTTPLAQSFHLGGNAYQVVLSPAVYLIPPPDRESIAQVPFTATLHVLDQAPEPSGLVLAGASATLLAVRWLRRRFRFGWKTAH